MNSKKLPTVVIIGRANVGKSTLFNKLIDKKLSIVADKEGVTRDRIYHQVNWLNNYFNLVDTGGMSKNLKLDFQEQINLQIEISLKEADLVIFLVSGKEGIQEEDIYIKKRLQKLKNKKVILVVNKIDSLEKMTDEYKYLKLGIKDIFLISSIHGHNLDKLLDKVIEYLPKKVKKTEEKTKIGIVGKPNVGKSTLLNSILKNNRAIVSSHAGTTRDSFDTDIKVDKKIYTLTDTAGIKKNKNSLSDLEWYAELRTNIAINNSDLILFILDYTQKITFIDEKIMGALKENFKPSILLVNKVDAYKQEDLKKIEKDLRNKMKFAQWIKIIFISAKTGKNLNLIFKSIDKILGNYNKKISISKLNQFLVDLQMIKKVPNYNGINIKLTYISYHNKNGPHFIIFSNHPEKIHFSYKRFVENQLRNIFDFEGIPINISYRKKV